MALGDIKSTVTSVLAPFVGGTDKATAMIGEFEQMIKDDAGAGAKAQVKPLVITAIAVGAAGGLFGIIALLVSLTRGRSSGSPAVAGAGIYPRCHTAYQEKAAKLLHQRAERMSLSNPRRADYIRMAYRVCKGDIAADRAFFELRH